MFNYEEWKKVFLEINTEEYSEEEMRKMYEAECLVEMFPW